MDIRFATHLWLQPLRAAARPLSILLPLLFLPLAAHAQTGKLSGTITDASGQPLIGATVFFVGTSLGAATDLDGQYAVINIPVGTHDVRFSSVGYQTKVVQEVLITSNNTTTLDVSLNEEIVEGEEIVVSAERPIVDVSLTSSMQTLSRADIEKLPVQELKDIVNLQAGIVEDAGGDLHFRGGRTGEVQFQVDGVSVNNPYNNRSSVQLDRSVLQEVQVISGTYDAEYGQAMSGVVNAVLRSGSQDHYQFSAEMFGGDYVSPGNETFVNSLGDTTQYFPHIDDIDPTTVRNYQFSLSGPMPILSKTSFIFNGQRYVNDGYFVGERRFVPTDTSDFERQIFYPTGDGAIVPLGTERRWTWLGKVTNRSIENIKIEYSVLGNQIDRKRYSNAFRLNPDGLRTQNEFSIVHGLDFTHTLSNSVFYTLSARQNYFDYSDYLYEDLNDPRYFQAGAPQGSANYENGAIVEGVELGRFVQTTNALVFKGSVTDQIGKIHLAKAGLEYQHFDLKFGAPGQIVSTTVNGVQQLVTRTDTIGARVLDYSPASAAVYAQDRVEWKDLRIRAGARMEYFDANSTIPSDLSNPANSIEGAPTSHPVSTSAKLRLAPRLGVSFPILDRASMFFSYGHFYQMPQLGIMFSNSDYSILEDLQFGAESEKGVLGNPDLNPEYTVQYEFGFKSELAPWLGVDLSLFYKDVRDLLGVEFVQTYTAASYARYTNIDFGQVQGFTLSVDQRGPGAIRTTLDYTFQRAVGNSSDPQETFNREAAGEDPRPRQVPFNWDQRNTFNGTVTWFERNKYSLTAIFRAGSGQPFTPSIGSVFGSELEPNSGRKNNWLLVDFRAEKFFQLGGLNLTGFMRVFNVFDEHFVNGFVFSDTGSPYYSLTPEAQRAQLNNPTRFHEPRRIELGISFSGSL